MAEDDLDEGGLTPFFTAARAAAPVPSAALMARVLADAQAEAVRRPPAVPAVRPGRRGAVIGAMLSAIGGWTGVGGLATAMAAGLWIGAAGLADPVTVTGGLWGAATVTVDLLPDADSFDIAAGTEW